MIRRCQSATSPQKKSKAEGKRSDIFATIKTLNVLGLFEREIDNHRKSLEKKKKKKDSHPFHRVYKGRESKDKFAKKKDIWPPIFPPQGSGGTKEEPEPIET